MHSTDSGESPNHSGRRMLVRGSAVLTAFALGLVPSVAQASTPPTQLPTLVTTENIREHMESLQIISDYNGGNRASGTDGYEISAKYVIDQLKRAGYEPRKDTYEYEKWEQNADPAFTQSAPEEREFAREADFQTMEYSGSGDVTAPGAAVNADSDQSGCSAADFADFPEGAVAIMQRGSCSFEAKADNASEAGASAAVVFNHGNSDAPEDNEAFSGTLSSLGEIPVVGTSNAVGEDLVEAGGDLELSLAVDAGVSTHTSYNVIADTEGGDDENAVVVGAHLDGVAAGAGINDNGSGTATVLETAKQLAKLQEPNNTVRFAFWGTEEEGLVGSTKYVQSLSDEELDNIGLYLNFDMLGSPNFGRFVYDGRGEMEGSLTPPAGSAAIQKEFEDYFDSQGLVSEPTEFSGRSDYSAFMEAGIASGGLFSGGDGVKTEEQVEYYGGTAGEDFDPNYHTVDDDIDNINWTAVEQLSGGVAHTVETYAESTLPVNGVRSYQGAEELQFDRKADHWLR